MQIITQEQLSKILQDAIVIKINPSEICTQTILKKNKINIRLTTFNATGGFYSLADMNSLQPGYWALVEVNGRTGRLIPDKRLQNLKLI